MPKNLQVDQSIITNDKKFTFLSGDVVAGASYIGIASTLGFTSLTTSSGQILIIGEIGQEKTEVIKTSNVSTSSGTNISGTGATLKTVLAFDHPQDTKVYIVDWDRFEIQWASTATGTKSTITTSGADYPSALQPDQLEAIYKDTTQTTGFYFVRFNETIGNSNSDWSDPIPFAGFDDNTVFAIKQRALDQVGEKIDGEIITNDYLNKCLWQARREYHQSPGKRPFRRSYNVAIGSALTGSFRIELPPYVEKPHSAENVYGVRIGSNRNMMYYDKKEWDFDYRGKNHSTLAYPYTVGTSTSLWLANGRDFSASATVSVEGTNIGLSRITGSQNSFTIITHGSWSASGGSDAWENISLGLPDRFTVFADVGGSSFVYFNRPIDTAYVNQNIYADYYRTILAFDSDADILDEPNPDIYVPYLCAMIKKKRDPSFELTKDDDYKLWLVKKQEALSAEYAGVQIRLNPGIDHLL